MAKEMNPAVRGLGFLALLCRGENLSGLDQAGDIGNDDLRPAALQHLTNHHKCGFRLGLDRVPRAEGKTSSRTDEAMHFLEATPPLDERMAEARQDGVEGTGGEPKGAGVHDLKADVPKPRGGGLVRGQPHGAFREIDPNDRAPFSDCGGGFERNDPSAATDIEDSFAFFDTRELEQTSGDRRVIRCHVRVVLDCHAAVLLNQEPGSLLGIQRRGEWPGVYMHFHRPLPRIPPYPSAPILMGMGRTIPTYRLHLESILNDWMDYRRALREKDREVFDRLLNKSRQHSSAASYCAHIDPSILALLSILVEMERDIEALKRERSSAADDSNSRADS